MELKKDYFPRAKAPDIAKTIVMQYVYWNKKNLSKRFYFYRVYAPAFLLLFIVWWSMTYYNQTNKSELQIYTINNDSWISSEFVENSDLSKETVNVSEMMLTDNQEKSNNNITTNDAVDNILVADNVAIDNSMWNIAMKSAESTTDQTSYVNAVAVDNPQKTLDQQISEIEILMDDISSITSQEEILF